MNKILWTLALTLSCCGGAAYAQAPVADFYSTNSLLGDALLEAGATIEAFDIDGVRCGYAQANAEGGFLIHVYGNDPMTASIDEGPREGEMLTWEINGIEIKSEDATWISTLIGMFSDLRFENGAAKEMKLIARTSGIEQRTWSAVKDAFRP